MNKIKIVADSTNDLSAELLQRCQVEIIPLRITLGEESFLDGVEINPDGIYEYYHKNKKLPKSSAAAPAEFEDVFRKWTEQGYEVICFTISSAFSSNYANALIASQEIPGTYVIDSMNLSTGIGLLIMKAAEFVEQGLPASEIVEKINALRENVRASFVLNTLEFLWKGGRCSGVAALGSNVLRLKPCIQVENGKMGVGKKYRGTLKACLAEYVKNQLADRDDLDLSRVFITHSGLDDAEIETMVEEEVKKYANFEEILHTRAGSTVSTHCGPNTLGVLFLTK